LTEKLCQQADAASADFNTRGSVPPWVSAEVTIVRLLEGKPVVGYCPGYENIPRLHPATIEKDRRVFVYAVSNELQKSYLFKSIYLSNEH
jgi:hypothetical protein